MAHQAVQKAPQMWWKQNEILEEKKKRKQVTFQFSSITK